MKKTCFLLYTINCRRADCRPGETGAPQRWLTWHSVDSKIRSSTSWFCPGSFGSSRFLLTVQA